MPNQHDQYNERSFEQYTPHFLKGSEEPNLAQNDNLDDKKILILNSKNNQQIVLMPQLSNFMIQLDYRFKYKSQNKPEEQIRDLKMFNF